MAMKVKVVDVFEGATGQVVKAELLACPDCGDVKFMCYFPDGVDHVHFQCCACATCFCDGCPSETLASVNQEKVIDHALFLFDMMWEQLGNSGLCDATNGDEFNRVRKAFIDAGYPADRRKFILDAANFVPMADFDCQ